MHQHKNLLISLSFTFLWDRITACLQLANVC